MNHASCIIWHSSFVNHRSSFIVRQVSILIQLSSFKPHHYSCIIHQTIPKVRRVGLEDNSLPGIYTGDSIFLSCIRYSTPSRHLTSAVDEETEQWYFVVIRLDYVFCRAQRRRQGSFCWFAVCCSSSNMDPGSMCVLFL